MGPYRMTCDFTGITRQYRATFLVLAARTVPIAVAPHLVADVRVAFVAVKGGIAATSAAASDVAGALNDVWLSSGVWFFVMICVCECVCVGVRVCVCVCVWSAQKELEFVLNQNCCGNRR